MFIFSEICSHSQSQATTDTVSVSIVLLFIEILYKRCGSENKSNPPNAYTPIPETCKYIASNTKRDITDIM